MIQNVRAGSRDPASELIERCDGFRRFDGHAQFTCPCCKKSAIGQFERDTETTRVRCMGDCSESAILAAARRLPTKRAPKPEASEPRGQHSERPPGRPKIRPGVQGHLDWERDRHEAKALLAEELSGSGDDWQFVQLTASEPRPEPTLLRLPDGSYLLRRGSVGLVHGLPGSAKTALGYLPVVDAVQRGETAMIIDYEMGKLNALALLQDVGLTKDQIDAHVLFSDSPPPLTTKARDRLVEECAGQDVSYVVIDALAGSMPSGASQNDAADVDAWFASMPKWLAQQFNAFVLVIDHSNKNDGPDPGGSVRKQGVPDFRMWLRLDTGFSKTNDRGYSTLIVQRDRSGMYGRGQHVAELGNEVRPDGSSVFALRAVGGAAKPSSGDVVVDLDAMPAKHSFALGKLEELRQFGWDGVMQSDFTGSGAAAKEVRQALDWLKDKGLADWRPSGRNGTGHRWWAAEFVPAGDV